MLKMMIVDDEKIIRETISSIIDWSHYDIEITGLCRNGIEAYDMILDESPNLVLTDIRMPGMDGIELIKKVRQTDLNTMFILLSGYGEFEYAKTAMKYGVKNYLLKPCNELQIIEAVEQCKKDYYELLSTQKIRREAFEIQKNMNHNVLSAVMNDTLCQELPLEQSMENFEAYLDFHSTPYRLFYVYFLEYQSLREYLELLQSFFHQLPQKLIVYGVYVNHTLLLFFEDILPDSFLNQLRRIARPSEQSVELEYESVSYSSLAELLSAILPKLKRFGIVRYINNFHAQSLCNYNIIIGRIQSLITSARRENQFHIEECISLIDGIEDIDFLKQLVSSLFLKLTANIPALSTLELTEWLMRFDTEMNLIDCKNQVIEKLRSLLFAATAQPAAEGSPMVEQICLYVEQHIGDSNITLKHIAENYLFMNVDYVSKKFFRETGEKFSSYLTRKRIDTAKKLIWLNPDLSIQSVAEQVGCGNNPQYFSQLFKKQTGMTPSVYVAKMKEA